MPKIAGPAWILVVVAATVKLWLWHLNYFRHPGPQFFFLYLGALALLALASFSYMRLRRARPRLIAWEPRAFVGFFLLFFLFYAPLATLCSVWIGFVAFSLGRLALGDLAESTLEQLTLPLAAGLGVLSALLFVLGLARLYYRWLMLALLAAAALLFWRNARRLWELLRRADVSYAARAADPLWGLCLVFVLVCTLSSAMVALSPEIAFDPISFHFVLARDYAAGHRIVVIPHLPYSYFPQNVEMLYTLGFLLDGQATAKVLTYAFFPLAALAVALITRRWWPASPAGPLVAAALFWTTPFISWTGSVAKTDLALALNLLLALYGLVRWIETERFGWLATGVLFLGFSFSVKHVAILGAVPWAVLAAWNLRRIRLSVRQLALLAVLFAGSGLYWHTRAWILIGNPLYPEAGLSAVRSTTHSGHPELSRLERLGIYLSVPWRVHYRGWRHFESPSPSPAGVVLVAFLPLLFWGAGRQPRLARLLLLFTVAYLLYWAAVILQMRFAIAVFGVVFAYLADRLCAARRGWVLPLLGYCFLFSLGPLLIMEMNVPRLKLFARRIDREQYLRETLVSYRAIEALNRAARPGARVYAVGTCSTFYAKPEFHCYYDYLGNYPLDRITEDLRSLSYQYLLAAAFWAEPRHMHVVEHLYHPALIYHDESFRLYRLRD
ncbi:MAG: hypothetical protein HY238_22155 [Acidobacteria bacterium]|nr:hypothetical protein [Acidobacteriota bacterium]